MQGVIPARLHGGKLVFCGWNNLFQHSSCSQSHVGSQRMEQKA
jgi:hypothetical protein